MTAELATSLLPTAFQLRGSDGRMLSVDLIDGGEDREGIGGGLTVMPGAPSAATGLCFDIGDATFSSFTLMVATPGGGQRQIPLS